MTIQDMHIGIDAGLKRINSNVLNALQAEEKDYYLNKVTSELIRAVLLDEKNTIKDIVSYIDIRKYYEVLQVYISDVALGIQENLEEGYYYMPLPFPTPMQLTNSGQLYNGVKYKVVKAGNTDLSLFGYEVGGSQTAGEEFVCDIEDHFNLASTTLYKGDRIKIINPAGYDFTALGAPNNDPNTFFVVTQDTSPTGIPLNCRFSFISRKPTWAGGVSDTQLYPLTNSGYYLYISSKSNVNKGIVFSSGELERGIKYKIVTEGTINLLAYGGYSSLNSEGMLFMCTASGTPGSYGGAALVKTKDFPNRLLKAQDLDNALIHSFGSTAASPIVMLTSDELRVYTRNQFVVNDISLRYIKAPVQVNYIQEIDSDLPESMHSVLVDLCVQVLAAHTGSEEYPQIAQENAKNIK